MSSIHDVARHTGVSVATVSRALRGLPHVSPTTREAVVRAAADLGYVPSSSAAALASGRHRAIAAIVPSLVRWFYGEVLEGADRELRANDYDLFIVSLGGRAGRERDFNEKLLRKRADAVLALGLSFTADERRELRQLQTPAIVVGGPVRGVQHVGIDETATATTAMQHLIDLGHRRIAHLGGQDDFGLNPSVGDLRRAAWQDTLLRAGIEPRADWFLDGHFVLPPARIAALRLLATPDRPTAVFAASDEMAFGVILAAYELGLRVPQDLSVIGIDGHSNSESFGLTTMTQDPQAQGALAARLLLGGLGEAHGETRARRWQKAGAQLTLRSSTAPPSA